MRALTRDAAAVFSLDVFKLGSRLQAMETTDDRANMVVLTILSDSARVFLVTCLVLWAVI